MQPRLGALLDDLCGHADGAGGDLSRAAREHVHEGALAVEGRAAGEEGLDGLVGAEEEGCSGRGAHDGGADAAIDSGEAAGGEEAGRGLEAGLEGVEGEEGEVDCRACEAAREEGGLEGGFCGGHGCARGAAEGAPSLSIGEGLSGLGVLIEHGDCN